MIHNSIIVFTDGSSRGNPGPGGFGAIIIAPKNNEVGSENYEIREVGGREEHTTNNRMELQAAISALSIIPNSEFIIRVYTDSAYLLNGITRWIHGWQKNGWKTKEKKDVENRDLWESLVEKSRDREIHWEYVGGHVGVAGNVRCDVIAQTYADTTEVDAEKKLKLYNGPLSDYPIKNILDISHDAGKVKEKNTKRARSSAKAYSYVSLVGGVVKTHNTWAECEARVKGTSAKYKKVLSADEEQKLNA